MSTLFTLATPEELLDLFGCAENIAYAREHGVTPDDAHAHLATLYFWRGEEGRVQEHLEQIADLDLRMTTQLSLYEIVQ
ncbi:hypothetical protein [Desulfovibrio cuneatus]|uniref:hypothetical protein n=1 Tax=Desulfovibrio cuneatus TaxID=159728 RepID=UPI0004288277|nr:hypothetical protein [Desulfovibrio cuneatus]